MLICYILVVYESSGRMLEILISKLIHIISVLIIVIVVHTVMISVVSKRQLSGVNPFVPIR